jgi:Rieske 2Fe-2S family protein
MIEPYLTPHRLREAKVAFESTIIEKGNWKLVWENNRECYHCAANHPELCKTFPEAPTVTGVRAPTAIPRSSRTGPNARHPACRANSASIRPASIRATRAPLLRDAESYTMTGKRAVKRTSPTLSTDRIGTCCCSIIRRPGTTSCWRSRHHLPRAADQRHGNAVTTKWLVHKDAVEGVDYNLEELTHVWTETNDQDRRIVEENAFGIRSPAYEPGPYSELHEGGVMQFVEWYTNFMGRDRLKGGRPGCASCRLGRPKVTWAMNAIIFPPPRPDEPWNDRLQVLE